MDQTVEIEQSELELVAEELDVKTEMKDIKSEVDADGKIERLNHEQTIDEKQDGNNFPIIPNNLIKIEKVKDEPEIYVKDTDTLPLNKELKIKNEICEDLESSYPDFKRRKTEDNTGKWNDSVLSMTNMVFKADPDVSSLHTEFDIKNESNPSTSAVPTTRHSCGSGSSSESGGETVGSLREKLMKIKAEMQNLEPKDQLMQRRSTILREKQIAEERLQQLRDDVERRQKELQRLRDEEERRQKKLQRLRDEYERHQKKSQQLDASVQYFARKVAKLESLKAKVRKLEELIPMVESIRDDWLSQEKHSI